MCNSQISKKLKINLLLKFHKMNFKNILIFLISVHKMEVGEGDRLTEVTILKSKPWIKIPIWVNELN